MWEQLPTVESIFQDYIDDIHHLLTIADIIDDSSTYIEFDKSYINQRKSRLYLNENKRIKKVNGLNNIGISSHPLKAAICLSLYSFVEAVCTNMMLDIYKRYISVFENSAAYNLNDWNDKIVSLIINYNKEHNKKENPLEKHLTCNIDKHFTGRWLERFKVNQYDPKKSYWFSGNIDCHEINKKLIRKHGVIFNDYNRLKNKNGRGNIIRKTMNARNSLAHGSMTFSEYGKSHTVSDMRKHFFQTKGFIKGLLNIVNKNLEDEFYSST